MKTKSEVLIVFLILAMLFMACDSSDNESSKINETIKEVPPKVSDSDALIGLAAVTKNWQDSEKELRFKMRVGQRQVLKWIG